MGALSEELLAIRLELKGVRKAVEGFKDVDKAQERVSTSTTKAGAAATRAEKKTSGLTRAYQRLGSTARWGLGFLGVGGVFALKSAVDASEDLALATSGLTRNFGLNTNVASRWAAVMHGRSVEPKALTMAFATLSTKMTEAGRSGGTLLTPFHQLGITQEEVARGAKDFEWGLLRVAKALGEEEGGARRSTAAKALLGKGFQTLTPLFSEGVEGLKEQLHWADKYGVTLSGTTKDGLMDMVVAQRETKVATLGLQIAMTKALMPAIEAGQDELHKFIATLNDPDMTADEKIAAIERQFERIEDRLIDLLTDALPVIAEHGGELGVKLAGALWQGFLNADVGGKLVIAAFIFDSFGGRALVKRGALRVGGMIGTTMGLGIATGAVGAFIAYEIWEHLSEDTQEGIHRWAVNAGQNFVNAFVKIINGGIREINDALDDANLLSAIGVDAPNIGEVGEVNFHDRLERQEEAARNAPPGSVNGPGGSIIGPNGEQIQPPVGSPNGGRSHRHRNHGVPRLPRAATQRSPRIETPRFPREHLGGRPRLGHLTVQIPLDGNVIAQKTVDIAELEASLR